MKGMKMILSQCLQAYCKAVLAKLNEEFPVALYSFIIADLGRKVTAV